MHVWGYGGYGISVQWTALHCLDANFQGSDEIMLSICNLTEGYLMRGPDYPSDKDSSKRQSCLKTEAN